MRGVRGLVIALIVVGLAAAVYLGGAISKKAALSINSDPAEQKVALNDQEAGETPYFSDQLDGGDAVVRFGDFNQKVRLTAGALTVVNWVLGPSEIFSSGEVVWFSESSTGTELLVITKPIAEVFFDGESLGDAPLSKPVEPGEYDLELKKTGYFSRRFKVSIREGFRLNVSANLALNPFPADSSKLASPNQKLTVWDLSASQPILSADPTLWVRGVSFWASRADQEVQYDFFLTAEGKLYDAEGSEVSLDSLSRTDEKHTLGYLGSDKGLSSAARKTLGLVADKLYPAPPQVKILETGLGFLRVRSGAGTSFSEIGKAKPGEKYQYLGKQGDWFKIDFKGKEGWVSAEYARKL
ncbi:MAG: hypothetical protein BMS9Abin34_141 [Patescibacteria group bacterium]|nr:MAG: hypothetical protein BMS9Abin34_141 [Patescibacteria group bacterium]